LLHFSQVNNITGVSNVLLLRVINWKECGKKAVMVYFSIHSLDSGEIK